MPLNRRLSRMGILASLSLGIFALMTGSGFAATHMQADLGPEDQSKQISVTVWLNLHNKASLDTIVEQMYDKTSPNYHKFLTMKEFKTQFAPTAKDIAAVRNFLAAHNMKVSSIDRNNHFIVAQGSVGDAQTAFNTKINRVMVNGVMRHATISAPSISEPATSALVSTVQGLSDLAYQANVSPAVNPETRIPYAGVSPSAVGANGLFFSGECLRPPETVTFTTGGSTPKAIYAGNRYGADINSPAPNLPSCGYDAAEMQKAYGLDKVYKSGLDGTGQTIVIVDAFGSNTIVADANLFSQLNNLPPLTSSNFAIFTPNGSATCTSTNGCIAGNWQFETTLDVEWAHAIAPGANIVLVLAADNSFTNLDLANLFAIENGFGTVLSNSFGAPEILLQQEDPSELTVENGISEIASALGISHNISSGDSGDFLAEDTANGVPAVSVTANAATPFATGVGGTSTFLDSKDNIELQTGWGMNFARIAEPTPNPPTIPPLLFGFQSGSGGGTSVVYAKPKYQKGNTTGGIKFRQVPDISMNADPETGNEIIVTPTSVPGDEQFVEVFGGTSLSTPMFSAFWSIANQAAANEGLGPLGNAAPILYELAGSAITDVNLKNADTLLNVTGTIFNPPNPPQFESATALAGPQAPTTRFVSALFQSSSSTRWDVFTFGTDSSLATTAGWDDVTGLGTPNGMPFINQVLKAIK
ncbi:MAG TPA: S53 family peptidase [Alloacidobacterium sp.]|nr:S53 family peptidase [Alloacidobacterium sp.]